MSAEHTPGQRGPIPKFVPTLTEVVAPGVAFQAAPARADGPPAAPAQPEPARDPEQAVVDQVLAHLLPKIQADLQAHALDVLQQQVQPMLQQAAARWSREWLQHQRDWVRQAVAQALQQQDRP